MKNHNFFSVFETTDCVKPACLAESILLTSTILMGTLRRTLAEPAGVGINHGQSQNKRT